MRIGRPVSAAIGTHEVLTTGIHGVSSGYIGKVSNVDQAIRNADIAAAAAIAYSKLNLALKVKNADIISTAAIVISKLVNTYFPETLMTTRGDIIYRGASNPLRRGKGAVGTILTMGADDPAWAVPIFGEGHILLHPWHYATIGQGTWTLSPNGTYFLGSYVSNTQTHNDGDNFTLQVFLAVGTYTLRLIIYTADDKGIIDIDINGSEVASADGYSVSPTANVVNDTTSIAVATAGLKTITVRLDGKNGSSSNHKAFIHSIVLWRTA